MAAATRKVKAVVSYIKQFEENITYYTLHTELNCRFKPGQFLHLALDPYDASYNWPESRAFSIANAPNSDKIIEILISPKGKFTNRMIRELRIGSEIWIKLPYGTLNFDAVANKNVVLVAGGTGISPFLSFLRYLLQNEICHNEITVYYGVRNPNLIIFNELLKEFTQKIKGFTYEIYCENDLQEELLSIHPGILPVTDIARKISTKGDTLYYLSGPKIMIETFKEELVKAGIPGNQVLYDKWE